MSKKLLIAKKNCEESRSCLSDPFTYGNKAIFCIYESPYEIHDSVSSWCMMDDLKEGSFILPPVILAVDNKGLLDLMKIQRILRGSTADRAPIKYHEKFIYREGEGVYYEGCRETGFRSRRGC